MGCSIEEKDKLWTDLDEVVESIPKQGESGVYFNGHVGEGNIVVRDTSIKVLGVSSKQRKEAHGRRDWRRRGGVCRGMKRVNKSIRKCDKRRRKRWRMP